MKLARFLFNYRITSHSTTGMSPSELMFGRQLNTHLIYYDLGWTLKLSKDSKNKSSYLIDIQRRDFVIGDLVYVRNFSKETPVKWIPGTVVKRCGNVTFMVHLEDSNDSVKRHKNQMCHHMSDYFPEIKLSILPNAYTSNTFP